MVADDRALIIVNTHLVLTSWCREPIATFLGYPLRPFYTEILASRHVSTEDDPTYLPDDIPIFLTAGMSAFGGKHGTLRLEQYLDGSGIATIDIIGHSVADTAVDASECGYPEVHVIPKLCAWASDTADWEAHTRMTMAGIGVMQV